MLRFVDVSIECELIHDLTVSSVELKGGKSSEIDRKCRDALRKIISKRTNINLTKEE